MGAIIYTEYDNKVRDFIEKNYNRLYSFTCDYINFSNHELRKELLHETISDFLIKKTSTTIDFNNFLNYFRGAMKNCYLYNKRKSRNLLSIEDIVTINSNEEDGETNYESCYNISDYAVVSYNDGERKLYKKNLLSHIDRVCKSNRRKYKPSYIVELSEMGYSGEEIGLILGVHKNNISICISEIRDAFQEEKFRVKRNKRTMQEINEIRELNGFLYKGVSFRSDYKENKWMAQIWFNKRMNFIGAFKTQEEAALAYDKKAKELLGEKAKLNFPNK